MLKHYERFRVAMTATGDVDKLVAQDAIERLYVKRGREKPAIIWCQSFYQVLTMPSLIIGILHSDMWELIAGSLTSRVTGEDWSKYWNEIWPDIWLNSGRPLLTGMNQTSRMSAFYKSLEDPLIAQTKTQFGKALHSGRLDNMQRSLKREMYRRFWARYDIGDDFCKSDWANLKLDIFAEMDYVRNQNSSWPSWKEIGQLDEEMNTLGVEIARLFDLLAGSLGGEPGGQASFILDLPAGLPWLATASLLLQSWPQHFRSAVEQVSMWLDIANNSSALLCLDGLAFVCEKPTAFHITQLRRLHNADGPALAYADGFAEYAWQGVLVPKFIIEDPKSITVELIESNQNVEIRRVMLERYGSERYIKDAHIDPIQEDEYGRLYRRELPGDEALVMVKVINSTPEPNGTFNEYFLRVPPHIETAKEAVAWTFDLEPNDYNPLVQT